MVSIQPQPLPKTVLASEVFLSTGGAQLCHVLSFAVAHCLVMFISWSQQSVPPHPLSEDLINHSASDCLRNYPSSLASGGADLLWFVSTPGIHHTEVNVHVELDVCVDGQCVPGGRTGVQVTQGSR